MPPIYLDNNATTPLCEEALEAMKQEMAQPPSNPSSVHAYGRAAKERLQKCRQQIAHYLGVSPREIIFNSGGTEGINSLIRGYAPYGSILTTHLEHACLDRSLKPYKTHYIPVGKEGAPSIETIESQIQPTTKVLALSAVNSETGVKLDLERVAALAEERGLIFIVDGVALLGKESFSIPPGVSAMAFSAHKLGGPKGVGFCYVSDFAPPPHPTVVGGGQELDRRAGTENLMGIAGMAAAIGRLSTQQATFTKHMSELKATFEKELVAHFGPNITINGEGERVCNTINVRFHGTDAETLLIQLDMNGVMASHGSACSAGALEPSRVLQAMGYTKQEAKQSIRFSFSPNNTLSEIEEAIALIKRLKVGQ